MRALVGNGTLSMQSTRIMRETERTLNMRRNVTYQNTYADTSY